MAKKKKVEVQEADEWIKVFVDGKLTVEGHSLYPRDLKFVFEQLSDVEFVYHWGEFDEDEVFAPEE